MKKNNLLNTLILAALASPGMAMAAEASPVTANVGFVTNYLYRGISQTGAKPAIQGGFDYAHASGLYAGAWGSNVSWVPASSASLELDTYFGFKNSLDGDLGYDVGFLRYNYPGVYAATTTKADTNEIYGAISWKWVTAKYSYSLGETFGVPDASGTSYMELNVSYAMADSGVTLGAHYGKQTYKGSSAKYNAAIVAGTPTYSDYKLSASKDLSGYVVGLAYSSTNATKGGFYTTAPLADGSTTDLGKGTAVLSVTHSF